MTSCLFHQLIPLTPGNWGLYGFRLGMRELAKLLLLTDLQNQTSTQRVLAFPQSNPVIIIVAAGVFPSPNLLTETTVVWDKRSGFSRTSGHLYLLTELCSCLLWFVLKEMSLIHHWKGTVWKALVVSHPFQTRDFSAGQLNAVSSHLTGCPHCCPNLILCLFHSLWRESYTSELMSLSFVIYFSK